MQNLINKIHLARCFDVLEQIPDSSIDLVLTDPPYMSTNLEYDRKAAKTLDFNLWKDEILRVTKPYAPILIFSSGKFTYYVVNLFGKYFRYELIWDKVNKISGFIAAKQRPLLNHEFILYISKTFNHPGRVIKNGFRANTYNHGVITIPGNVKVSASEIKRCLYSGIKTKKTYQKVDSMARYPRSILRFNKASITGIHPSAKPLGLLMYLIELYSNQGNLVLDTFSGSGAVAKACKLLRRDFIATELDANYHAASLRDLRNDLFTSDI